MYQRSSASLGANETATDDESERLEISEQFGQCGILLMAVLIVLADSYSQVLARQSQAAKDRVRVLQGELVDYRQMSPGRIGVEAANAQAEAQLQRMLAIWASHYHSAEWHQLVGRLEPQVNHLPLSETNQFLPNDPEFEKLDQLAKTVFTNANPEEIVLDFIEKVVNEANFPVTRPELQGLLAINNPQEPEDASQHPPFIKDELFPPNLDQLASRIRDDVSRDRATLVRLQVKLMDRILEKRIDKVFSSRLAQSDSASEAPPEVSPVEEHRLILEKFARAFHVLSETDSMVRGK